MTRSFLVTYASMILLAGCPPKTLSPTESQSTAPTPPDARSLPTPGSRRQLETHTLSNGLKVIVASNHEVPLWDLRIANIGAHLDPDEHLGLAEISFAMMNEGAGERTSEEMSRALNQMASSIRATPIQMAQTFRLQAWKHNLEPTIALWADVLQTQIQQRRMGHSQTALTSTKSERKDPNAIARRVYNVPFTAIPIAVAFPWSLTTTQLAPST